MKMRYPSPIFRGEPYRGGLLEGKGRCTREANAWRVSVRELGGLPKRDRVSSIWKSAVFHTVVGGHSTALVCAPVALEASQALCKLARRCVSFYHEA